MLDFDKASEIELTRTDVERKLVPAFLGNDSYFLRPNMDLAFWDTFATTYVKASRIVLRMKGANKETMELPATFLSCVNNQIWRNEEWDTAEYIIFE